MIPNNLLSNDVQFRRGIFNILNTLKQSMDSERFEQIIDLLQEKLEQVPANDLEQSKQFFYEIANFLIRQLEDYYEITHAEIENDVFHGDAFTLKRSEEITTMVEKFKKYKGMARFRDAFLQNYNYDFWRKFRTQNYQLRMENICTLDADGNLVYTTNKIPLEDTYFLPKDNGGRSVGVNGDYGYFSSLWYNLSSEKALIESIQNDYDTLNAAVDAFNVRLEESLREEHLRFGIVHMKQVLSKIVTPVALIENEQLRELCEEAGRTVFVKTPTMEELMYLGSSVHIYSSHDMNDDSSYIAKPIIISETLPGDTEELKYLGVGQYTAYDAESPRSLDGANPYVINNNIFVKASYEDFLALIPEELVEEMRICENLVESLENPLDEVRVEENETLLSIIDNIKQENTLDPQKVVEDFMSTSEWFAKEEEVETGPIFIHQPEHQFERTAITFNSNLLSRSTQHPHGFVVIKDQSNNYAALRMTEEGTKEIYITQDVNEAFRALQLPRGLYSIYDFRKRTLEKQQAILSIHNFAE